MDSLNRLAEDFSKDTILFIGSGASMSAGLPSWKQLVIWLRDFTSRAGGKVAAANTFIDEGDLLKASGALAIELTKQGKSLSDFFIENENCGVFRSAEPKEVHRLIAMLPTSSIITTNYDLLLEKAYELVDSPIQVVHKGEVEALNKIKRNRISCYLYKYHGCITRPDSIVLDYKQYRAAMHRDNPDIECLKNLIQTKTFVFVGAGLEDPDFNHIRDYIVEINQSSSIEFWAFMRNCESKVEYYKEELGINLINYTSNGGDHSDLLNKLETLSNEIRELSIRKLETIDVAVSRNPNQGRATGSLKQKLLNANAEVMPLDEQIMGFVAFFDTVEKNECFEYLCGYKEHDLEVTSNRVDYLVGRNLLKQTENFLLPVPESYSVEAAELMEDDLIDYLARRSNG